MNIAPIQSPEIEDISDMKPSGKDYDTVRIRKVSPDLEKDIQEALNSQDGATLKRIIEYIQSLTNSTPTYISKLFYYGYTPLLILMGYGIIIPDPANIIL